jgi:hypothetical protein
MSVHLYPKTVVLMSSSYSDVSVINPICGLITR